MLAKGGNRVLSGGRVEVHLGLLNGPLPQLFAVCLDDTGRLRAGPDLVVPSERSADGAVEVVDGAVRIDPTRVDPGIARVVAVVSAGDRGFAGTEIRTVVRDDGEEIVAVSSGFSAETLVMAVELYRHQDRWKIRHLGEGYANGIVGLAHDIGLSLPTPPDPGHGSADETTGSAPDFGRPSTPGPTGAPAPTGGDESLSPGSRIAGVLMGLAILLFFGALALISLPESGDSGVKCGTEVMDADDVCVTDHTLRHTRDEQADINERGDFLGLFCFVPLALVGAAIIYGSVKKDPD
ncbi:TerD family protein [Nocardia sp. NPDC058519]|uniref:TerD family protein n=1 Tax=Nocardia sp. NPDC058519 TaxID=3346535 RepID=UPI00365B08C7